MISGLFSEDEVPSIIYSKGTWYTLSAWEDDRPVLLEKHLSMFWLENLTGGTCTNSLMVSNAFYSTTFPNAFMELLMTGVINQHWQ